MRWIEEDSIQYNGFDTITIFRDSENEYMKLIIKVFANEISAVAKGEYIEISLDDSNEYYYAFSVSKQAGVTPYKIYKERK